MSLSIGLIVMKRRKELSLSQEVLAEKVEVSERTIRRIEKNMNVEEKTLKAVCEVLNISVSTIDESHIRTPKKAVQIPNIHSSLHLAHILIDTEHVEIDNLIHGDIQIHDEEEEIIDLFIEKCEEICGIWSEDNPEQNKTLLNLLQNELDKLYKRSIYVSGSCTDSLLNNIKVAKLSFYKY